MSYQVRASDLENIRLNERDTVSAVLQNIALILATPKGSGPFTGISALLMSSWTSPCRWRGP